MSIAALGSSIPPPPEFGPSLSKRFEDFKADATQHFQRATARVGVNEEERQQLAKRAAEALQMLIKAILTVLTIIIKTLKQWVGLPDKEQKEATPTPANPAPSGSGGIPGAALGLAPGATSFAEAGAAPPLGSNASDWMDASHPFKAAAPRSDEGEIIDVEAYERTAPAYLGKPLYLLPGDREEAVVEQATQAALSMVARQLENPEVRERVAELLAKGDTDAVVAEIMGPTFEHLRDHTETVKKTMADEISEIVRSKVPDESLRAAAVNEIIEALPVVTPHSALDDASLGEVVAHLRGKGVELEQLAAYRALMGAGTGLLAGTFDPLKDTTNQQPYVKREHPFFRRPNQTAETPALPALTYDRPRG
jgi:hypothetical protein